MATVGKRDSFDDGVWLIFSQVSPPGNGPAYLKTLLKSQGGSLLQTREIGRGSKLSNAVAQRLADAPSSHPLDTPVVLADMDGQRVRLMVGDKSELLDAEPGGAPSTPSQH